MLAYTLTSTSAVVLLNNKMNTIPSDHPRFETLKEALRTGDIATVQAVLDTPLVVKQYLADDSDFTVEGGLIVYKDEPFAEPVSRKALLMVEEGADPKGLLNFLRKVRDNPSRVAQEELLLFWTAIGGMIHEDGDIIAFKGVRQDFTDCHTGRFTNVVGTIQEMARHRVDDRRENACSYGFHIGSLEYASGFAQGHVMIVKANPKDIVSIPNDAGNQKCRTCRYEVIGELEGDWTPREVYNDRDLGIGTAAFYDGDDDDDFDDDEDIDDTDVCEQCGDELTPNSFFDARGNEFCSTLCRGAYLGSR